MPTYLYETVPPQPGGELRRFEVRQSMHDAPLKFHPETGEPVRRIISGGYGFIAQKSAPAAAPCNPGCACHRAN